MKEISNTSKVFILFGALSVFINEIREDTYRFGAKLWYNRLDKLAKQFWKQIQNDTKSYDKEHGLECTWVFDEMEAYPQLQDYAKEVYGESAEGIDAFVGYVNRIIEAINGVIHVIDTVLVPQDFKLVQEEKIADQGPKTVVDIALSNDDFSILVAALQKADLVGALQGEGPFTVFAPTNAAFEDLLKELEMNTTHF